MYQYEYYYEAKSIISDISLHLSDSYVAGAIVLAILTSILAFALTLFTAIAIKRARPYGIIVALAQPVGVVAALQSVLQYAKIDFSSLEITVTSTVSLDAAMDELSARISEVMLTEIFPQMVDFLFWAGVLMIIMIMTIVYMILLFHQKGKALAIVGMLLVVFRHIFIPPVAVLPLFLQMGTSQIQSAWDVFFSLSYLLPLLLLAIQGVIVMVQNAKAKKAAVAAAVAPTVEEAPVVEEAPTAEEAPATEEEATN